MLRGASVKVLEEVSEEVVFEEVLDDLRGI